MKRILRPLAIALALAIVVPSAVAAFWPVTNLHSAISRGYRASHRGIDIYSPRWTQVVPMRSGATVFAGWRSNCGGYQVWVNHGHGLYSAYYHLAREITRPGHLLTGGVTRIGYVGSTGCATGPHLHIEVWRGYPWRSGSYRVNPWPYIDGGAWLPYRYR